MNAWMTDGMGDGDWVIAVLVLALVAGLAALALRRRFRRRGDTPMVALVRRRRELQSQLQTLAGADSEQLVRDEARRLKAGTNRVEVLEAAIVRAEQLSARGELPSGKPPRR